MRIARGFTLLELIVSVSVLLLLFGVAFGALVPVFVYLSPAQAKVATQQNAVPLLYKLQREVRQSDYRAIYVDNAGTPQWLPTITTPTDVTSFAVASAKSGAAGSPCFPGGDFKTVPNSGAPFWQGFNIFMLQNASLKCVYEPLTSSPPGQKDFPSASDASIAFTAAAAVARPATFGNAVLDIKISSDASAGLVDFQIKAVSTVNGHSNATTYTENILARN
jgi:prepilin-type N-terminal cleavage/methylation domain-containing protein